MKISARNQLKGTIIDIQKGAVNGIVKIQLPGGEVIASDVTIGSIEELDLKVGMEAYAIVKAMHVMVGVDH